MSEGVEGFRQRWQQEESDNSAVAEGQDGSSDDEPVEEVEIVTVTVEGEVVEVYVNEEGQVVAVDQEGNEEVVAEEVPEEGQALAVTDSNGNSFTVDSGGSVSSSAQTDSVTQPDSINIQQALIEEVLRHFQQEVNTFLENKDKGPLDENLLQRLAAFPDCLPEEAEALEKVLEKIDYFETHMEELIALVGQDETDKARFDFLVGKLNGQQPPFREELTEAEWDELIAIVCPFLLPDEVVDDTVYNFFVTDNDAWYREKAPYTAITPVPETNILAKGLQVSVLETVKDSKNKDVAKIKLKSSGESEYTTLSNLSEVEEMSKELKYKMLEEYAAVKLPYATESADKTYEKDAEFTAYKRCGDYVKVKGEGSEIEGHWIEKSAAIVDCGTGFCCQKCGNDLTLTLVDLQTIYGQKVTSTYVTYLNEALKKGGFNTCTSHAHFFAQSMAEVGSNFHLDEIPNYQLHAVLKVHRDKASLKDFYQQSFWDDETYLDYFQYKVYKKASKDYKGAKFKGSNKKTFTWGRDNAKSVKVPTSFIPSKDGKFQKVKYSKSEVKQRNKKLFSNLYANKYENGEPSTEDGWKFRGRGLIHLTWRTNYRLASNASNNKLDYIVDWEANYKDVSENPKDVVYSAVAYFLFKLNTDKKFNLLHNNTKVWDISKWVNGINPSTKQPNGWSGRRDNFNTLIKDLFKCDK